MSIKHIYITHVEDKLGAFGCVGGNNRHFYSFCPKNEFINWIKGLSEDYPEFKLVYVENEGIREYLRKRLNEQKKLDIYKQIMYKKRVNE